MRRVKHLVPLVLAAALLAGCMEPRPPASTATASATATGTVSPTVPVTASPNPTAPARVTPDVTVTTTASSNPSPTPSPTRTASPTPNAVAVRQAWETPPTTGIPVVDGVVRAMTKGDPRAAEPFVVGAVVRCKTPSACAPGSSDSGLAVTAGGISGHLGCAGGGRLFWLVPNGPMPGPGDEWVTPALFADRLVRSATYLRLIAIVPESLRDEFGVRYRLAFQTGLDSPETGVWIELSDTGIVGFGSWTGAECAPKAEDGLLVPLPPTP
jgi:hypothetical protein